MPHAIDFITFATIQAQDAQAFGFTRNECCRNLKTALHQYWQNKTLGLHSTARKSFINRSESAVGLPLEDCVVEHTVPLMVIVKMLMDLKEVSPERVSQILERFYTVTLVTREEHQRLTSVGLRFRMPEDWDGIDIWHRYRIADIRVYLTARSQNSNQ